LIEVCYEIDDIRVKERELKGLIKASEELKCASLIIITWDYEVEEKFRGRKIILLAVIIILCVSISSVEAGGMANVPLDDWSYSAINKLMAQGIIKDGFIYTRPYTRYEMAELIAQSLVKRESGQVTLSLYNNKLIVVFASRVLTLLEGIVGAVGGIVLAIGISELKEGANIRKIIFIFYLYGGWLNLKC